MRNRTQHAEQSIAGFRVRGMNRCGSILKFTGSFRFRPVSQYFQTTNWVSVFYIFQPQLFDNITIKSDLFQEIL